MIDKFQIYLNRAFPIKHRDGVRDLPSCPYQWPDGQGDAGKFLSGIENSALWESKYGSVYRIWAGMKPEIVLTRPHQLSGIFGDSDKHIKAAANDSGAYMDQLLGKCIGLISGAAWRRVRAITETPFGYRTVSARLTHIESHVIQHFDGLHRTGRLGQGALHPAEDMKMLPFWIVCELFYGQLPPELVGELVQLAPLREHIFHHVVQGGLTRFAWSKWLPIRANTELRAFQRRWRAFNAAARGYAQTHDATAPILRMYEALDRGDISEDELVQTLDESLYANLDVTTGALSWNLVFLAAHQDVQERLRTEVQLALREDRMAEYVCSDSTYLAACVLESSRLKPLAAFSVPQAAPTTREVDGYMIPARTNIIVDSYALNIQSDTWAPDNATYRPDRFLEKRGAELRYRFWRFGFGPRQCMGKYVADLTIRRTLVHIVQGYDLGWLDKEDWARKDDTWITHPDFLLKCTTRKR
ncbi:uncharacterized protein E0L32_010355 [Thyridium curvatum]|uniref:Cytochrome P450 n=1 Tax=Thyridium curvatum TaxID=1093900 RepID=A0A507AUK3_9PEZI|nr:uncharacterized protein E0L32_010355 [Thyridium curvatum]TPX07900.1 hypothetical protein E0L32_010355 [Thyridium curvatum]